MAVAREQRTGDETRP